MQDHTIRLHHFEPASIANGPGLRAVVWVQGCAFGCPGCFNPETHAMGGGELWPVEKLAQHIIGLKDTVEGLTISGGEPLYQHRALAKMVAEVRAKTDLSILVFSGYDWEELQQLKDIHAFLAHVDVLLAGRYKAEQRVAQGLVGSANKTVHFLTGRYSMKDLDAIPQAEIILSPDGEIKLSGIDPLTW